MEYVPAKVIENRELAPGHGLLTLGLPEPQPEIKPGQFLQLRCDPGDRHSLMRPFSILDANALDNTIGVYYKGLGRLSSYLCSVPVGTELDCLYPLGTGFPWQYDWRRVALIGGGVGLAPLLFLARHLEPYGERMQVTGFFGGASGPDLVPELLKDYDFPQQLATMDGSVGFQGTVVDLFSGCEDYFDVVYTCGPNAMMRALQDVLPTAVPAFASLEERMACGVGACYGCVAAIKAGEETENQRVCLEGPVFELRNVVFGK